VYSWRRRLDLTPEDAVAWIRDKFVTCFELENLSITVDKPLLFCASTNLSPERCPVSVEIGPVTVCAVLAEQGGMDFPRYSQEDLEFFAWLFAAARKGAVSETWWISKRGIDWRHEVSVEYQGRRTGRLDVGPKCLAAEVKTVTYQPW